MTDYIELVLGEQGDEREERESLTWGADMTGHIPTWGGEPLEMREMDAGRGESLGQTSGQRASGPKVAFLEGDALGQAVGADGDGLPRRYEYRLAMTEHETRRRQAVAGEAAEGLRARLRRAEVAAGYRGEMAATEVREEWSGNRGRSVLELDAAFSRDARRYDNGFELF